MVYVARVHSVGRPDFRSIVGVFYACIERSSPGFLRALPDTPWRDVYGHHITKGLAPSGAPCLPGGFEEPSREDESGSGRWAQCFDDLFPCLKEEGDREHVNNWVGVFRYFHNHARVKEAFGRAPLRMDIHPGVSEVHSAGHEWTLT